MPSADRWRRLHRQWSSTERGSISDQRRRRDETKWTGGESIRTNVCGVRTEACRVWRKGCGHPEEMRKGSGRIAYDSGRTDDSFGQLRAGLRNNGERVRTDGCRFRREAEKCGKGTKPGMNPILSFFKALGRGMRTYSCSCKIKMFALPTRKGWNRLSHSLSRTA